jgi:hypothetical protein
MGIQAITQSSKLQPQHPFASLIGSGALTK